MNTMLILRGIAGHFAGKDYPHGALDEPPALGYATLRGRIGRVLDISGETGPNSAQTRKAIAAYRFDTTIDSLYGFSGGGYNIAHIFKLMTADEHDRLKLVVVLGAPKNDRRLYAGPWELVYRNDPPGGHMDGPRALLAEPVIVTKG